MALSYAKELHDHVVPGKVEEIIAKYRNQPLDENTFKAAVNEAVEGSFRKTLMMLSLYRSAKCLWANLGST